MNSGKKSSSLRNIWSKKLEGSRSSNSGRTQQRKRHQMMDDVFQPRLVLPADVKEEAPEEQSPDVDQQEPEPLQIKEEQEELWTSQEGEQLTVKEETDTRFPLTAAPIKNLNHCAEWHNNSHPLYCPAQMDFLQCAQRLEMMLGMRCLFPASSKRLLAFHKNVRLDGD
ncbi:uncharacterized protein LOC124861426 isoform X8 [Girardinichthys multiradiatus]|uniref:uncharacterized protein LOC124861426 isoform X8 n=1 Tax=Girardinichthys multiradiatus TaxID=208333 RepID=UPI001FAE3B39|nr:uncharacterized protein LOC124861426 isoform X8 [Girardinichthys multiradiatus]